MPVDPTIKLSELRKILAKHAAFQNASKLEKLAQTYNVKVIFVPKFHCELNAIEGLWSYMKQYVRKMTDQSFPTMMRLIPQSRKHFAEKTNTIKTLSKVLAIFRCIPKRQILWRSAQIIFWWTLQFWHSFTSKNQQ